MRRRAIGTVIIGAAILLSACGGGGGGVDKASQPYVDALIADLQKRDNSDLKATKKEAECFAPKLVAAVGGGAALNGAGATPAKVVAADSVVDSFPGSRYPTTPPARSRTGSMTVWTWPA